MPKTLESIAFAALVFGLHIGAIALTAHVVTESANASARFTCRREAALALISSDHCAHRKAGATSTAWSY